ncbi:MAG: MotA/TolQ/ExbB proton channel family protein [Gammaproteobacteria bacterium]|nr:MotA/TolQ/ExbB proton channel family protein [Gammaproteobacteria bacterium]
MNKGLRTEFIFQVFALLIAFILVHAIYVSVIRPQAEIHIQQQQQLIEQDRDHVEQRSLFVVLRDYEQEACFILMLWAFSIMGFKGRDIYRQQMLLNTDLLQLPPDLPIGHEDVRELSRRLQSLPDKSQRSLLPRAMITAIERFGATRNVQDVSTAARDVCESEAERQESELSIIRYIAWAIPSVGFIGTVRGIGDALGQAHRAVEGDITGVTQSLGVAFNSTFVALVISIVLMFFIHQLQLMQERHVLDCERYVDHWFVRRLKV